jgi:hypothetical protein
MKPSSRHHVKKGKSVRRFKKQVAHVRGANLVGASRGGIRF